MAGRNRRPLAPAVPLASTPIPSPTFSTPQASTQARRNITTACRACRRRRSKCDDNTPCSACVAKQTECVRDQDEDGRRKVAWKRKVEELESDNRSLPDLLDAIRTGEDDQVDKLVAFIRSQASQAEVVDYVATNFARPPSAADHEEGRSKPSTRQQSPSLHQSRLPKSIQQFLRPWISVPAKPWTRVTDDDELVSHLVSLWFTWRHWCYPFIERDGFISAMQSKNMDSAVCTPYLVNMILADACFDYDIPDGVHSISPSEKPLRELFFDEARRYMDISKSKRSLPAIQYLGVQWMYLGNSGLDSMSISVMHEVVHHLKQLDRPGKADRWKSRLSAEQATRAEKILGYTTWATFVSTTAATFAMRKDPLMRPPDQEKPDLCPGDAGELWIPYPQDNPSVVAHADCHLRYLGRLFEICYNISEYLFTKDDKTFFTQDTLEDLHRDLTLWYDSLIGCIQIDTVKSPHTLSIHAQYHWSVMVLSELNFTSQLDDEDDATVALLVPVIQAQHMAAALAIADLAHRQCIHWGVNHVPTSFLQPINAAIPVITSDLEPAEHKSAFVKLAISLHSLARRSVSAESALRMLRLRLRQKRLMASGDIDRLFTEASEQWEASLWAPLQTRKDSSGLIQRLGINSGTVLDGDDQGGSHRSQPDGGGTVDETYDLLIEKWNHFNLGALSSSSSSSS